MKTFFFIAYPILNRLKHQPNFYTFQNRIKNLCHSSNLSIFKFILIKPMIYIDWEMLLYHYWWCDESLQYIEYNFAFSFFEQKRKRKIILIYDFYDNLSWQILLEEWSSGGNHWQIALNCGTMAPEA